MEARGPRAEEAASPVVATVLLTAVTIVLAAGVHYGLQGGGIEIPHVPRHVMLVNWALDEEDGRVRGIVASASPDLTYDMLDVAVDDARLTLREDAWRALRDRAPVPVTERVRAGDAWDFPHGSRLRVTDAQMNLLLLDLPLPPK